MHARNLTALIFVGLFAGVGAARGTEGVEPAADPHAQRMPVVSVEEMARLNGDVVLFDARLRAIEAKLKVRQKQLELDRLDGSFTGDVPSLPKVRSIEGMSARLRATIVYSNGTEIDVVEGDALPNGLKVVTVRPGNVTVVRNNHTYRLGVVTHPELILQGTSGLPASGMPLPPPGMPR